MKIVLFEIEDAFVSLFRPLMQEHEVVCTREPLTLANAALYADADILSTFNESDTTVPVLGCFPDLKHFVTRTTGFDHMPLAHCRQRGISVSYVPHYGQQTVAEHAFGLLLSLAHQFKHDFQRPLRGDFIPKGPAGFDLYGKTLGIIGTGNIGRHVLRIAQGFNMRIVAHDIRPDYELARQYSFPYLSKTELLAVSDIVTLHVPADDSTYHLIGADEIAAMREGAVLVNTARGTVVDVVALYEGLISGQLGGACLDVLPNEPLLRSREKLRAALAQADTRTQQELLAATHLLTLPNVVITPHMGYNTKEAIERILGTTLENIEGFLSGQPVNPVPMMDRSVLESSK